MTANQAKVLRRIDFGNGCYSWKNRPGMHSNTLQSLFRDELIFVNIFECFEITRKGRDAYEAFEKENK